MVQYRRNLVKGGTYFFTVTLINRHSNMLTQYIDLLRESVKVVKQRHPFEIVAWVVLPDHLHAVWRLPMDDCDYSNRWRVIKPRFSIRIFQGVKTGLNVTGKSKDFEAFHNPCIQVRCCIAIARFKIVLRLSVVR